MKDTTLSYSIDGGSTQLTVNYRPADQRVRQFPNASTPMSSVAGDALRNLYHNTAYVPPGGMGANHFGLVPQGQAQYGNGQPVAGYDYYAGGQQNYWSPLTGTWQKR